MSYLLEFPPSTLPPNVRSPPFVIFAINGVSIRHILPQFIPLAAVLHFIPKLADFVVPMPDLPQDLAKAVLATPLVGLNIQLSVGVASVQRIVFKIMQAAGFTVPQHMYTHPPSLTTAISLLNTWKLLDLPVAGIDNVITHVHFLLIHGPPVTLTLLQHIFNMFPPDHAIPLLSAQNFVDAHCTLHYSLTEFTAIRRWYRQDPEFGKMPQTDIEVWRIDSLAAERARKAKKEREEKKRGAKIELKEGFGHEMGAKLMEKLEKVKVEREKEGEDLMEE
ncbi:hypothetical protein FB567DRAFT_626837 [Paraphoma chrysanthemicola]|uniref:Uncharacterized protein n=1 Tax=Paraphoma chrysanthemicola TaxID=798071 RepID=A0A8K0R9I8_9PLEO|nr:hypothetical protein FB567DRAFT_626837 [Paraphoma chrysanthemicola]